MAFIGLIGGVSPEATQIYYRHLNKAARARRGGQHSAYDVDGIILGCTELCMILDQRHSVLPVFDTTSIHAGEIARQIWDEAMPSKCSLGG